MLSLLKENILYFVDHVLISHVKNVNDVNIFIIKYRCLGLAMETTKLRGYVSTRKRRGCERVNPLFPFVVLRTILTFLTDLQLCCKRIVGKSIHEINGA